MGSTTASIVFGDTIRSCSQAEEQSPRGSRARGVEEVAVAAHLVGPLEPAAERAARIVVEERRDARAAWQRSLFEPEQKHDLEPARAGPQQIEHGDAARLSGPRRPHLGPLEGREQLLG